MSVHELSQPAFDSAVPRTPLVPHRFSIQQYHQMIAAGILAEGDQVELLDGVVRETTPVGIAHRYVVDGLMQALLGLLPSGWRVCVQQPINVGTSEPQPDLSIVRGTYLDYRDHHPGPGEIGLLIEVAESSLSDDRIIKGQIYAAAGVPEYWIVNLIDRCVEIRRDPRAMTAGAPRAYQPCEAIPATGKLTLVLDGQKLGEIPVASILP